MKSYEFTIKVNVPSEITKDEARAVVRDMLGAGYVAGQDDIEVGMSDKEATDRADWHNVIIAEEFEWNLSHE